MEVTEIIARRQFAPLYIWLDLAFLVLLAGLLLWKKQYLTLLVGFVMGWVYMAVDYGIFHLVCHARSITPGYSLFWVLLWMSMSYGFTNFVWIWLWLRKDEHLKEWSVLIVAGWLCTALLSQNFGSGFSQISISRGTGSYHGVMALLLFVGYAIVCVYNMRGRGRKIPLLWLLAIGVLVQFSWEAVLLVTGIRAQGFGPLVVNSLLETNLGIPYIYFIQKGLYSKFGEYLTPVTGGKRPGTEK